MRRLLLLVILLTTVFGPAYSHKPRLAMERDMSLSNAFPIREPDVSQAYYGELKGSPDYYSLQLEKPLNFYLGILVPDIPVYRDVRFSVSLYDSSGRLLVFLDGNRQNWVKFHEPFGNDDYLQGPEARNVLSNGVYSIVVSNVSLTGRYTLVTGEKESFGLSDIFGLFDIMPRLKKIFFNK